MADQLKVDTAQPDALSKLRDPLVLAAWLWPKVTFYREQREIIRSVEEVPETYIPAGNQLG